MKQSLFTMEHARQLTADTYELVLSGDTSAITAPGQFVNIQLPGKFLRRPISICNWTKDALLLLVRVVGEGTHDLVRCVPGTELDVLSGLGNGFDLAKGGAHPILLGGGIGIAPLYGLAQRMLEAGEDPLYVARRLVRFASEDVGLADSRALEICVAAYQACHFLGMPECTVHLTHAAVYLSAAPKSNALYKAYETAKKDALEMLDEPVPLVIRNAPTRLMKELHYGEGYQYAHDAQDKLTDMQCLPDSLQGRHYYVPTEQGSEARVAERLAQIEAWRAAHRKPREKE